MNDAYLDALRELACAGLRFATFGTAGLLLRHPGLRTRYELRDADVLIPPERVDAFGAWWLERGAGVTSWNAPWSPGLDVTGRYYLRVHHRGLQLDATYETFLDLDDALSTAERIDDVPVCREWVIWRAKFNKHPRGAREFAERFGLTIPADLVAQFSAEM